MTPHDEELQSRLLRDAAFVTAPLHFFIEGIRLLLNAIFWVIVITAVPIFCFFTSPYAKDVVNRDVEKNRLVLRVDYQHTSSVVSPDFDQPSIDGKFLDKVISLPLRVEGDKEGRYFNGVPVEFCNPTKHGLLTFVTPTRTPDKWSAKINLIFDPLYWAEGKSAPMYDAYASAAYTVTALRRDLAAIKYHTPVVQVCRELSQDAWLATETEEELTAAEASIRLSNIPVVRLAYLRKGVGDSGEWTGGDLPDFLIGGICLESECVPKDLEYNNPSLSHEFFGPTFTTHQKNAMAALTKVASDEFWLTIAHANGITSTSDYLVRQCAARTRRVVTTQFPEYGNHLD